MQPSLHSAEDIRTRTRACPGRGRGVPREGPRRGSGMRVKVGTEPRPVVGTWAVSVSPGRWKPASIDQALVEVNAGRKARFIVAIEDERRPGSVLILDKLVADPGTAGVRDLFHRGKRKARTR